MMKKLLLALTTLSCAGNILAMDKLPQLDDIHSLLQVSTDGKTTVGKLAQLSQLLTQQITELCDTNSELIKSGNDTEANREAINTNTEKIKELQEHLGNLIDILRNTRDQIENDTQASQ